MSPAKDQRRELCLLKTKVHRTTSPRFHFEKPGLVLFTSYIQRTTYLYIHVLSVLTGLRVLVICMTDVNTDLALQWEERLVPKPTPGF